MRSDQIRSGQVRNRKGEETEWEKKGFEVVSFEAEREKGVSRVLGAVVWSGPVYVSVLGWQRAEPTG